MGERIEILVADDHTLLREALRDLLQTIEDFRVVGEAGDGDAVLEVTASRQPDVILLDIEMPRSEPLRMVSTLLRVSPRSKVIVLSMHDDPPLIQEMLSLGVRGYLHKSANLDDLTTAIQAAHRNCGPVIIVAPTDAAIRTDDTGNCLSAREHQVLTLVAKAMSNRQIAARLSIAEGTVKRHLRNIYCKLGAASRIDAVNKAAAASLSQDDDAGGEQSST
jgi:two-component system nitrate/nitrite response regulator NarL